LPACSFASCSKPFFNGRKIDGILGDYSKAKLFCIEALVRLCFRWRGATILIMRQSKNNSDNMQFPFMGNCGTDNADASNHDTKQKSPAYRPLCTSDQSLFNAIFEDAKKRGTQKDVNDKKQWLVELGYKDLMRITGRSKSSVRRLINRLIDHGHIDVVRKAKGGTEATIYRIVAP
jgi:hypothetical protein